MRERMTIQELNGIGKPFIVLVNSKEPQGERAQNTAKNLEQEYGVRALPVNCEKLTREDICQILSEVLLSFRYLKFSFCSEMGGDASKRPQDQTRSD